MLNYFSLYIDYILLIILVFVFLFGIGLIYFFKNKYKKKLSKDLYKDFLNKLNKISQFSYREKIVEYDKYYHLILKNSWYDWNFWDILKKKPYVIKNINKIWELHKFRNKLVHESLEISDKLLQEKASLYEKEIKILLNNVK